MKNLIYIIFLILTLNTHAQIINFPDPTFKIVLTNTICVDTNGDGIVDSNADLNNDGEIQVSEGEAILSLNVGNRNISSLEGIEYFINMTGLNASQNLLTAIDLSQNEALESLIVSANDLQNIDLSQNLFLINVKLDNNENLQTLDISQNTLLENLTSRYMSLTEIDLSQNVNLTILQLSGNPLNTLDLSHNSALEYLIIEGCYLDSIDVTNLANLYAIDVDNNNFVSLDLSQNTQLYYVFASQCDNLTELDLSNSLNLIRVQCLSNDLLSFLNIQNGSNANLEQMWTYNNPLLTCIQVDDEGYANAQPCNPPNITGWCIDDWTSYSENCNLGIDKFEQIDFTLFPNPSENILEIYSEVAFDVIRMYTLQGQLIGSYFNSPIDVSGLSSGIYLMNIEVDGTVITKKFKKL